MRYKPIEPVPASAWQSREKLKNAHTSMYCPRHGLQLVVDFRPLQKWVVLECGCERKL